MFVEGFMYQAVAKVTGIISSSPKSFEDAIVNGIARATDTLKNVEGAWAKSQKVVVKDGKIAEYRTVLKVSFVLTDIALLAFNRLCCAVAVSSRAAASHQCMFDSRKRCVLTS
jgi:flavin-binding protein dodecin